MTVGADGASRQTPYFTGLNTLRFWAAFLVFLGHVPMTQASRGLPNPHWGAVFYRGAPAVSFFFVLSGFLITYLLLAERRRTGGISVRNFYIRRMLRIWPLYFLVIGFGLFFYNVLLPKVGIEYPVHYSLTTAILPYVFFLPGLMNSLYTVGGILNPTWSIGVEEQFYLSWAPLVRLWAHRMPALCGVVFVLSFASFAGHAHGLFRTSGEIRKFAMQLKFHFMASGALAAWALHERPDALLRSPVFRSKVVQWAFAAALLYYLFVGSAGLGLVGEEAVLMLLFTWLVVDVGANPRGLVRIATPATEWLGRVSYGLYMFHMIGVYATAWLFLEVRSWEGHPVAYVVVFYGLAFGITVGLSAASHRWFEGPILRLKGRFAP